MSDNHTTVGYKGNVYAFEQNGLRVEYCDGTESLPPEYLLTQVWAAAHSALGGKTFTEVVLSLKNQVARDETITGIGKRWQDAYDASEKVLKSFGKERAWLYLSADRATTEKELKNA